MTVLEGMQESCRSGTAPKIKDMEAPAVRRRGEV